MIIRQANKSDLAEIKAILNDNIANTTVNFDYGLKDDTYMQSWFSYKLEHKLPIVIAEIDGKVAGYASYGPFRPWDGYRFSIEHSIYTHNDFQRKGVGKALIETLIQQAKKSGYKTMIGCIDAKNINSIHFHQKFGFDIVGKFKDIGYKFDTWLDCVFVQLILQE
ncbi:phosphinothricin acetyltransferase [Spirosomataceae bacterium TFI 002]|nr:phosphinothricin acetyltransferase [Spirosomataceae bacterium TFI 002]